MQIGAHFHFRLVHARHQELPCGPHFSLPREVNLARTAKESTNAIGLSEDPCALG